MKKLGASVVFINARFRTQRITGVQRYATEICNRLQGDFKEILPKMPLEGAGAHLWEQVELPVRSRGGLIWNPCATGPIWKSSIVTIHDFAFIDHPEWFSRGFARAYQFIVPRVIERSKHILCVSEFTRSRLTALFGVPSERITIVPNGVSVDQVSYVGKMDSLEGLGLSLNGRRYLLSVCSQEPRKNIGRLIEAWNSLLPRLPKDMDLILVGGMGSGKVFANNQEKIGAVERVYFTGYVSEVQLKTLYSNAFAFIYPSIYEGFGLPPLEAMSFSCPVLASNTTAIPEVMGKAGLLFDPMSSSSISNTILEIVNSLGLHEELKGRSKENVLRYSWGSSAEKVQEILLKYS